MHSLYGLLFNVFVSLTFAFNLLDQYVRKTLKPKKIVKTFFTSIFISMQKYLQLFIWIILLFIPWYNLLYVFFCLHIYVYNIHIYTYNKASDLERKRTFNHLQLGLIDGIRSWSSMVEDSWFQC